MAVNLIKPVKRKISKRLSAYINIVDNKVKLYHEGSYGVKITPVLIKDIVALLGTEDFVIEARHIDYNVFYRISYPNPNYEKELELAELEYAKANEEYLTQVLLENQNALIEARQRVIQLSQKNG